MISGANKSFWGNSAILTLASFSLTAPLIFFGASSQSDDALDHARWYSNFAAQLWAGDLYPRWLSDMNFGLGSPAFYYYPPLPYYFTSVLHPIFSNDPGGWHQIGISAAIALALSGLFAFMWLRLISDDRSAFIGGLLYIGGPYHLASDLYVRFAFAELWSFVWMPLILYFVHRLLAGDARAVLGISASYALLVMTHLPTTMLFSACVLPYGVWLAKDKRLLGIAVRIAGAMLIGAGIAAVYLYPALTMESYVFLDRMSTGYFSYSNWLLPSTLGLWTSDKVVIALMASDLLMIAVAAFTLSRTTKISRHRKVALYWIVIALTSAAMMTDLARPVWWLVTPLQKIQFPFRFGTILTLAMTALITLAVSSMMVGRRRMALALMAAILIAAWIPGTIWAVTTIWRGFYSDSQKVLETRNTPDMPEYRPRWNEFMSSVDWNTSIDEDYWDRRMSADFTVDVRTSRLTRDDSQRARIDQGSGRVTVAEWQPRNIVLDVLADTDAVVEIGQFYFPTWTAAIDGVSADGLQPKAPHGLMSLAVPSGQHEIRVALRPSREEGVGQIISAVSLVIFVFVSAFYTKNRYSSN